ncbi:Transcriptional activator protein DAL81 [Lachnellula suecica]|uniref:Transcriptional activator protein DAL81 n=1 Tax=Lachnellula suecica TaxID=602035 RepID=A0A8T9CEL4_9HELO|nr:Transcriptional activator protein DAL81 [Lachnellula suecica]
MTSSHQPRRKDRPCDACRKRKSRCSFEGEASICVLCKFHGQDCTFLQNPQSRKRKTIQDPIEVENPKRRLSSSSVRSRKSPVAQTRVIRTTNGTGVEEYDDLEGPSLLKKTLGLQNKHHSQYVGATRGLEPAFLGQLSSSGTEEVQLIGGALRRVSSTEAFLLLPDPGTQGYEEELDDLDAIEAIIRPHGKALVDLYFRIVFPSFPILHKAVYLEKYNRSYREFSPPLLAAVYLLALHYWTYDDKLSKSKKPDVQEMEKLARKALGDTIHRPKISTVQAGLLLLQHTDTDSAELTAQLVSVAYGLGLHLDASEWNIPSWEKGLRKRLGWALYMQDKWSSLGSGRPSLINSANWALQPVTNSDFPENASHEDDQEGSTEVEKGRILFGQMINLSEILADLLDTVFTVKTTSEITSAGANGLAIVLEKVKPVQLRLKEWFSSLPECLSMESTPVMKLNSVGYLRLAYVATEITLHRRIMLALSPSTDPQLYQICRSVAHERFIFAIEFVQSLKPQHLSSFWYFASPQNFALIGVFGTLLLSTASNTKEVNFYQAKLREYRWTLKINTENGARYMKPAMALLDANRGLLKEASRQNPSSTDTPRPQAGKATPAPLLGAAETFPYSNSPLTSNGSFASPSQYNYEQSYYPDQAAAISPSTFSPDNLDAQTQEFGFGIGSTGGMWSY